jgi:hypothetical protein
MIQSVKKIEQHKDAILDSEWSDKRIDFTIIYMFFVVVFIITF